jgi:transposase
MSRHVQRTQKTLEDANLKLASVITDVMGVTGRATLAAVVAGEDDPDELLALKRPRVHASDEQFLEALRGRVTEHHRFLLQLHLDQIDGIQDAIGRVDAKIAEALAPFRDKVRLLRTIPGVEKVLAAVILGEIGSDMSHFPTSAQLISWAGMCPRNDESAGKRRSTRVRRAGPWLKPHLVQAAWAAIKKKDSCLRTQYYRLRSRRGPKKAIIAVAASMLTAAYHILRDDVPYHDLGPAHFDSLHQVRTTNRLVKRLTDLGYDVSITPSRPAA